MERIHIKIGLLGFPLRVTPLQNVFHKECCDADLNTDVLEFFSGLQNELVGNMMDGACVISQHRSSKDVAAEDLLCHLDTQWNLDPLLMSANCIKTRYRVTEITDKIDLSLSPEPLLRKRRSRCSSNLPRGHPASSKIKKNSAKKSKLKSKCNQSITKLKSKCKEFTTNSKSNVNSKSQEICPEHSFKTHLPRVDKKPELKFERQFSIKMSVPDSHGEFLEYKYKQDVCNVDCVSEPSTVVPLNKHKSKAEENISICESSLKIPPVKEKEELQFEIPIWYCLDPKTNTLKVARLRQDVSVAEAVLNSLEAPICKLKSNDDTPSSTCEHSIKVFPIEKNIKPKTKVPTTMFFDSETHTFRITGLRQDVSVADAVSKHSSETPLCKPKLKMEKKDLTCESLIKVFPFKEKTKPECKVPIKVNFCPETLTHRITKTKNFTKQSPKTSKSNAEDKMPNCEHSTERFSLKEKIESKVKIAKKTSIKMPCQYSQVFKLPRKKHKQELSGVKCASVKTLEAAQPSVEMTHPDSYVHRISFKRQKREVFGVNDPVETPDEARRRLATVLLRIAGRY